MGPTLLDEHGRRHNGGMGNNSLIMTLHESLRQARVQPQRVVVAVSGGADSVALLLGLHELRREYGLELIVAHFHHRLRGAEANADVDFVERLAKLLSLPCIIGYAPIETDPHATGIEARARDQRYNFLLLTATAQQAPVIMTAHTADDRTETVLHHLFRGTGVAGLRGIPRERALSSTVRVVRPMLSVSRSEVVAFLQSRLAEFRTDSTNTDVRFHRNWIRHHLLPDIRAIYPHADAALQRLSQQAEELAAAIAFWANQLLDAAVLEATPSTARLRRSELTGLPRHVQRECFVRLWERQQWPRDRMTAADWDRAVTLLLGEPTTAVLPGGVTLTVRADLLVLTLPVAQSLPPA